MSADRPDDDKPGYGNPPIKTRWKDGQSGNLRRRYPKRTADVADIIDKLLLKPIEISVGNKSRKVTTLEAILLRLWQKEVLGDARALKIRLKYQKFAREHLKPRLETVFLDNEYTAAFAAVPLEVPDKDDD